ncbi:shk1 kinase-binding protein 1 [Gymnopilus junonius]|uniref:Protein arginine N-methyltransferase n=1 Tax=Gymnopilus junonius TaxID=109634 RepID=A0A9P5NNA5_GYMJU|nr:shk1 kinase-binding protein 1 [Gymnopilus junonius]
MDYHDTSAWDPHATISTYLTLEDIAKTSNEQYETPILKLVADSKQKGYKRLCIPLTTEKWKKRWSEMCLLPMGVTPESKESAALAAETWRLNPGFRKDEVTITRLDEAEGVIALISEWLELDAADDWVRHDAEIALKQELAYATYLNIQTVILPPPRNRDHVASYARIVQSCLTNFPYLYLSIRLPIYNPSVFQPVTPMLSPVPLASTANATTPSLVISESEQQSDTEGGSVNATWEMWDLIRSMCDYNIKLTLTIDLSPALPTTLGVLSKWAAESVRHIFLPSSTFIANMKGYPHRPNIILAEASEGHHSRGGEAAYSQYVRHLEKTSQAVQVTKRPGTVENFAQGYQDYLQAPLQPLMDNLPSITYQTFEQDPVKYAQYEEAMYRAFLDYPGDDKLVVCIAGAGRGPLVARCFRALERADRDAMIIAVEKNPNAFVTLQERQANEWDNKVHLVFGDMRVVNVPEKANILVSELLGSFGDNELSPECLDGAARFLKPNGISIPSSYTAHLAPLSSSKLYNEARSTKTEKGLETPYVVMFQAVNILSLPITNSHNARSARLRFYIPHAGILHGLAGYFEAVLYGNIGLSIHPHRKDQVSKDMLSWFPLFFPFREPLYLPSNSELQVSIWRLTNTRQIWYEWHAESFISIPKSASSGEELLAQPSSLPSASSFSSFGAPSPLVDSKEPIFLDTRRLNVNEQSNPVHADREIVKIGHTSLHNAGGRSSWIGL